MLFAGLRSGIRDRDTNRVAAKGVERTDTPALQGFVKQNVVKNAELLPNEHGACQDIDGYHSLNAAPAALLPVGAA